MRLSWKARVSNKEKGLATGCSITHAIIACLEKRAPPLPFFVLGNDKEK